MTEYDRLTYSLDSLILNYTLKWRLPIFKLNPKFILIQKWQEAYLNNFLS